MTFLCPRAKTPQHSGITKGTEKLICDSFSLFFFLFTTLTSLSLHRAKTPQHSGVTEDRGPAAPAGLPPGQGGSPGPPEDTGVPRPQPLHVRVGRAAPAFDRHGARTQAAQRRVQLQPHPENSGEFTALRCVCFVCWLVGWWLVGWLLLFFE